MRDRDTQSRLTVAPPCGRYPHARSHLQGMWFRTLKMVESGIKPVYVFEGKPPTLKGGTVRVAHRPSRAASCHDGRPEAGQD